MKPPLRSTQPSRTFTIISVLFCFCFFHSTLNSAPPLLLLGLLVQLHVRHQDVLLRLLRQAGVGAAVASAFVGAPGPDRPPAVQVDDDGDQRHQEQGRHQDDDQRGQVVVGHWGGGRGGRGRGSHPAGERLEEHANEAEMHLLVTASVSVTANTKRRRFSGHDGGKRRRRLS